MNKTAKKWINFLIVVGILTGIIYFLAPLVIVQERTTVKDDSCEVSMGGRGADIVNLIGTKSSPRAFFTTSQASTTVLLGDNYDLIDINVYGATASSTGLLQLNLEKSNDSACNTTNTATTSGTTVGEIVWYDITPQTSASGNAITMNAALTQYSWTPGADGEGTTVQISDWNAECLRITASSTAMTLWISAKPKLEE